MIQLDGSRVWNINPLVVSVDNFASDDQCETLISIAERRLRRAKIVTGDGSVILSGERTNSAAYFQKSDEPPVVQQLKFMIGAIIRMPITNAEPFQVLHYKVSQQFTPHLDGFALSDDPDRITKFEADGGQRLFSTMIYLNDVKEGGATSFPKLNISVEPRRGRLLIFANTLAGSRDSVNLALHAGDPVSVGEKWSAITWWRDRTPGGVV